MDVFDTFFKKFAYKFPKGYPDINDVNDKKILFEIIYNLIPESEFNTSKNKQEIEENINEEILQENN